MLIGGFESCLSCGGSVSLTPMRGKILLIVVALRAAQGAVKNLEI